MVILIILLWIGSLISGWNEFWLWLFLPIVAFTITTFSRQAKAINALRANGMSGDRYRAQMMLPNLMLIGWNAILNGLIFGVGFVAHSLIG